MHIDFLSGSRGLIVHYIIVILAVMYMLYRHRKNGFDCLFILLFCDGVFAAISPAIQNIYKIVCFLWCLFIVVSDRGVSNVVTQRFVPYLISFLLFGLVFVYNYLLYPGQPLTLFFSQTSRYIEIFIIFYIIYYQIYYKNRGVELGEFLFEIFLLQILLSVLKIFTIGNMTEGISGTMAYKGGGIGTGGPLVGIVFYWIYCKGKLDAKQWLYAIGLLFWGFMTAKRAVLLTFPLIVLGLSVFVERRAISKYVLIGIMLVPVFFYLGVRLNPTLNPDNKYWGRFDLDYAMNYADKYQNGDDEHIEKIRGIERSKSKLVMMNGQVRDKILFVEGRGSTTKALLAYLLIERNLSVKDWWGWGLKTQYYERGSYDYTAITDLYIQPTHTGSATGIYQMYVAMGIMGIITMLLFSYLPLFYFQNWRLGVLIAGLFTYDFFMYSGLIFRTPALMATLFFVMHYTNYEIAQQRLQRRQYYANLNNNSGI